MRASRRASGFTLLEMMVVVAIIGLTAAIAVPSFLRYQENARARAAARDVADAFHYARSQAIATGDQHMVFFAAGATTDPCGNPLDDADGNPVPILVLNDGPPGGGGNKCCIDAGEAIEVEPARRGISWGVTNAGSAAASDPGLGNYTTGTSFSDPSGSQTRWVRFRPDGVPVGVASACGSGDVGNVGSGGGGVYVTNGRRDYAIVLAPLGGVKLFAWDEATDSWSN